MVSANAKREVTRSDVSAGWLASQYSQCWRDLKTLRQVPHPRIGDEIGGAESVDTLTGI